jgi:hypothetical protein
MQNVRANNYRGHGQGLRDLGGLSSRMHSGYGGPGFITQQNAYSPYSNNHPSGVYRHTRPVAIQNQRRASDSIYDSASSDPWRGFQDPGEDPYDNWSTLARSQSSLGSSHHRSEQNARRRLVSRRPLSQLRGHQQPRYPSYPAQGSYTLDQRNRLSTLPATYLSQHLGSSYPTNSMPSQQNHTMQDWVSRMSGLSMGNSNLTGRGSGY